MHIRFQLSLIAFQHNSMFQRKSTLVNLSLTSLLITAFTFSLPAQSDDDWKLKSEKSGVKVYYRKPSDIYELKLATSIKVPLSGIVRLFDEVDKYPSWGYKVSEARLLKRVSPTEMYYYSKIDFPWPMSDRDLIQLCSKALSAERKFGIYGGTSANSRGFLSLDLARRELGYEPQDNAETLAKERGFETDGYSFADWQE